MVESNLCGQIQVDKTLTYFDLQKLLKIPVVALNQKRSNANIHHLETYKSLPDNKLTQKNLVLVFKMNRIIQCKFFMEACLNMKNFFKLLLKFSSSHTPPPLSTTPRWAGGGGGVGEVRCQMLLILVHWETYISTINPNLPVTP